MKNLLNYHCKSIGPFFFCFFLIVCFQQGFSQDDLRAKKCPKGLYPNGDNCYPCLGCHPCPGPNGTTEYCSNTNAILPRDASADAFLVGYSFSDGKMVPNNNLAFKKEGTILFQIVATNKMTGEKVFPNFMVGAKLEVIRKKAAISTGKIDQTGRVLLVIGNGKSDAIWISGIKRSKVSIPPNAFKLPTKNALSDLMDNARLTNLKLEIVAFTPKGCENVNFSDFQSTTLTSFGLPAPNERATTCNPDAVACNCGTNICGKDADACCRICDYLEDGTYSEGCKNAISHGKVKPHTAKPRL